MTKEEAIKTINKILKNNYLSIGECRIFEYEKEAMKVAVEALEQPERKRGKWETDEWGDWHCSICKAIIEKDEQSRHYYKYCYHCGAEMDG